MDAHRVIIVGGGQAGLAASHALSRSGIDHRVLERGRIGESWRRRWDSFCLVLPNWSLQLPGFAYEGDDPDGFLGRDAVVRHLEDYARSFGAPVTEGVAVTSVSQEADGRFLLETGDGPLLADRLILATGSYQRPHRPEGAAALPDDLDVIDANDYRNPQSLRSGGVLIVGSGQTGCQIADDLHRAGRDVVLACGRAPWAHRRTAGRDSLWWAAQSGALDQTLDDLPGPQARLISNPLVTGRDGGRDLNLRTLHEDGVNLAGHFRGASHDRAQFADDLKASVEFGDARFAEMLQSFEKLAQREGIGLEPEAPAPFDPEAPDELPLSRFGTVIFASGYRPDYASWLPWPDGFDEWGFPRQDDGASTVVEGLYFLGVHFMRKRKSSLLMGVGEDAEIVAQKIAA